MRRVMPKHSIWRVMQFDTLRLRLIKLAARVIELKTQVKIHLPSSAPDQAIFAMLLNRLPRLLTGEPGRDAPQSPPVLQAQRRPNSENKPAAAASAPHACRTGVQPKRECQTYTLLMYFTHA